MMSGFEGAIAIADTVVTKPPHEGSAYGPLIAVHVGGLPVSTLFERHSDCAPASMRLWLDGSRMNFEMNRALVLPAPWPSFNAEPATMEVPVMPPSVERSMSRYCRDP